VNFYLFSAKMFEIAMCHLTAATVASAKDEDFLFFRHVSWFSIFSVDTTEVARPIVHFFRCKSKR
ncbi:MAG: hypothetical protein ACK52X_07030, partial [bacterium]